MMLLESPLSISCVEGVGDWIILELGHAKGLFKSNTYYHVRFSTRTPFGYGVADGVIIYTRNGFKKIISPFRAAHLSNCNSSSMCENLYVELVVASIDHDDGATNVCEVIGFEEINKKDLPLFVNYLYKSPMYLP